MNIVRKNEIVKEIIAKPPHKIIEWGSLCIFSIFIFIFIVSFAIKYPEFIQVKIVVENQFISIIAPENGMFLDLYKRNSEVIKKGDTIAAINNYNNFDKNHVIESPINGKLIYCDDWNNRKQFYPNECLFNVASILNSGYTGYAEIPTAMYNKISKGQKVYIYMDEYPYTKYGILTGSIESIIEIPKDGFYKISIKLPNTTSLNKKIQINIKMDCKAKIIIKETSIGERLIDSIKNSL